MNKRFLQKWWIYKLLIGIVVVMIVIMNAIVLTLDGYIYFYERLQILLFSLFIGLHVLLFFLIKRNNKIKVILLFYWMAIIFHIIFYYRFTLNLLHNIISGYSAPLYCTHYIHGTIQGKIIERIFANEQVSYGLLCSFIVAIIFVLLYIYSLFNKKGVH